MPFLKVWRVQVNRGHLDVRVTIGHYDVAASSKAEAEELAIDHARRMYRGDSYLANAVKKGLPILVPPATTQLAGTTEAAAILGTSPQLVNVWMTRGKMPEPVVKLACGPIWAREDVEALNQQRKARARSTGAAAGNRRQAAPGPSSADIVV